MDFKDSFSGYSVNDLAAAKTFYSDTLGLVLNNEQMGLDYTLPSGARLFIYPKPDHEPAKYTVLNFIVGDIDTAVDALLAKGGKLELYPDSHQDERGVVHSPDPNQYGPSIAWFCDPAGNILSLIEASK